MSIEKFDIIKSILFNLRLDIQDPRSLKLVLQLKNVNK